jgi:hypothetical protein
MLLSDYNFIIDYTDSTKCLINTGIKYGAILTNHSLISSILVLNTTMHIMVWYDA